MRISIMQPTYLPWCGYFDHLYHSDTLVFLDDVAFAKQRSNWQKENRILLNHTTRWLRLPTLRVNGPHTLIKNVTLKEDVHWREQHLELISVAYKKAPFFHEIFPMIEETLSIQSHKLSEINTFLIKRIGSYLHFDCDFAFSSHIDTKDARKADKLITICKKLGATEYYSSLGSMDYIVNDDFKKNNISLAYQNFIHPQYAQPNNNGEWISHLSVIDMLFNEGANSANLIKIGHHQPLSPAEVTS